MPRRLKKKVYKWDNVIKNRIESNPFLPDSLKNIIGVLRERKEVTAKEISRATGMKEISIRNSLPLVMRHEFANRERRVYEKIRELEQELGPGNVPRDMLYAKIPEMSMSAIGNSIFKLQIMLKKPVVKRKIKTYYGKPKLRFTTSGGFEISEKKIDELARMGMMRYKSLGSKALEKALDEKKFKTSMKKGGYEAVLGLKALAEKADRKTGISIFGDLVFKNIKIDRETFANPIIDLKRSERLAKGKKVGKKFKIKDEEYVILNVRKMKIAVPKRFI